MPSKRPLVSVLMPVLNPHPVYFREAVQSVLAQTLEDFELIIVEDPSPASAADTLTGFNDARIHYYRNLQRTSLIQQRNKTLDYSRADLIACLDADDICEPTRLQKQFECLEQNPHISVLGSQLSIIDASGAHCGYRHYPRNHCEIEKAMARFNPIANPSVMFRKTAVVAVGAYQYDRYPAEDYELWCRLAQAGVQFANHPEPLLRYRIHPGGMKSEKLKGIIRGTLEIKRMYWVTTMGFSGRVRMWLERCLLLLPSWLVLRMFTVTQYRRRPPRPHAE